VGTQPKGLVNHHTRDACPIDRPVASLTPGWLSLGRVDRFAAGTTHVLAMEVWEEGAEGDVPTLVFTLTAPRERQSGILSLAHYHMPETGEPRRLSCLHRNHAIDWCSAPESPSPPRDD
jgi:hypothetical protein